MSERIEGLAARVRHLLDAHTLPFHGWPHVRFVWDKAAGFARQRGADVELVEAAALTHDLNYVVQPNSHPAVGRALRFGLLAVAGFGDEECERIEAVVLGAHTATRQRTVDDETACLSDADTLYKALPITPVLYAHRYLAENGIGLAELADQILTEQATKPAAGFYFYDPELTARYRPWIDANLGLWAQIRDALDDPAVAELVREAS